MEDGAVLTRKFRQAFLLVLILGLGAGLRLHQIGRDPFWLDEVGVAVGSQQPSLAQALEVTRSHIMGMPLDYVIAWGVGRFSESEGALRAPEALWGTLTLLAAFLLYRELSSQSTAFLGMFLLAITPIHINYSQELRFYAPLVFFYTLAAWLALKAVKGEKAGLWLLFTLTTFIGILFHVFTVLVLVNTLLWAFLSGKRGPALWRRMTLSAAVIMIFMAIAVISFGNFPGYSTSLTAYESFQKFLLGGMGWFPVVPTRTIGLPYYGLCMAAGGIGTVTLLRKKMDLACFAIPLLIAVQVFIILVLDVYEKYFISSRQLLILLPLSIFLAAVGIEKLIDAINAQAAEVFPGLRMKRIWPTLAIALVYLLAAIPALADYYHAEKTATLYIINWLSSHLEDGQVVAVYPDFEERNYSYYLPRWSAFGYSTPLAPEDRWPFPVHPEAFAGGRWTADYLVTGTISQAEKLKIEGMGYELVYSSPPHVTYPQSIWRKPSLH